MPSLYSTPSTRLAVEPLQPSRPGSKLLPKKGPGQSHPETVRYPSATCPPKINREARVPKTSSAASRPILFLLSCPPLWQQADCISVFEHVHSARDDPFVDVQPLQDRDFVAVRVPQLDGTKPGVSCIAVPVRDHHCEGFRLSRIADHRFERHNLQVGCYGRASQIKAGDH